MRFVLAAAAQVEDGLTDVVARGFFVPGGAVALGK